MTEPIILNGSLVASELYKELPSMEGRELSIITIGDDEASKIYVRNKIKAAERVGLKGVNYRFSETAEVQDVVNKILDLHKPEVVGIIVQKPYPKKFEGVEFCIDTELDVDGLGVDNTVDTLTGRVPYHYPATPDGIITLLDYYKIPIEGKNVVVIGRSDIVGKPIAAMMTARNATVTLCHSKTSEEDLNFYLQNSDIIISAVGKPHFISSKNFIVDTTKYLGGGVHNTYSINMPVIIDVGINRIPDPTKKSGFRIVGDVDYESVLPYVSAITPVPGGIGPMTIYSLIKHCSKKLLCAE